MHFHPSDNHIQCVHGRIFVLRLCILRVWASSLCSGCGRKCTLSVRRLYVCAVRVWAPALCSGCGQKCTALCSDYVPCVYGYPHFAQAVGKKCIRTVLRLFFFSFFFSCRPHATPPPPRPVDEKQKRSAA